MLSTELMGYLSALFIKHCQKDLNFQGSGSMTKSMPVDQDMPAYYQCDGY